MILTPPFEVENPGKEDFLSGLDSLWDVGHLWVLEESGNALTPGLLRGMQGITSA
jgi:hypothetical protein